MHAGMALCMVLHMFSVIHVFCINRIVLTCIYYVHEFLLLLFTCICACYEILIFYMLLYLCLLK